MKGGMPVMPGMTGMQHPGIVPPSFANAAAALLAANGGKGGGGCAAAVFKPPLTVPEQVAKAQRAIEHNHWAPPEGPPPVYWMEVSERSALAQQGYPQRAPICVYQKGVDAFSSSSNILTDIVGDIDNMVTVVHDPEWDTFPDVAKAMFAAISHEECFAIATCSSCSKWGVGAAAGWKGREAAAKLALSIAMVAEADPGQVAVVGENYPEFKEMLFKNGLPKPVGHFGLTKAAPPVVDVASVPAALVPGLGAAFAAQLENLKAALAAQPQPQQGGGGQSSGSGGVLKAPPCFWLMLPPDSRIVAGGLPAQGPAIIHSKEYAQVFGVGAHLLYELLGPNTEHAYNLEHDPEWSEYPEMVTALKAAGTEEQCYAVMTCPSLSVWALGVAGGWKAREQAGKLALALVIAHVLGKTETLAQQYPEFAAVATMGGLMAVLPGGMSAAPPDAKRQRT